MLLFSTSVALLLGFIGGSTAYFMARQTDATIAAEVQGLAEQYRRRGLTGLSALIAERIQRDPGGAAIYLLADSDSRPLVGNLEPWPAVVPDRDGWIQFRLRHPGSDAEPAADHPARAQVFPLHGGLQLLVGRDIRDLAAVRGLLLDTLAWGLAITAALALLGGWVMSAGVVRRLELVNQVSREIMDGDLSRRVPGTGSGDEFDQLAANLNRMLERIEQLMASVRQVSDSIAHDLRTPLARLRQRLELVQRGALTPAAASALEAAVADAEELLATFNALLRIARLESGERRAAFAPVDLAALLADVVELYEPLAADKGQALITAVDSLPPGGGALIWADRDLLFQALANLVDNAIKYTPAGGRIELAAVARAGGCEVSVSDTGPGIPAALRGRVCERFFRIDDSRAAPGNGLGLSLVQAVAQLHGAALELADAGPGMRSGLRVSLTLPRFGPAAPRGSVPGSG
ncbi:MAG: sensor histidine kinase [Chromatiaceae bacterium]|nr:MAG: sensor histidine kinase [Chromatiaceae bacterium]